MEGVDQVTKLRIELRLERLEHSEKRKQFEIRVRELENEIQSLRTELQQLNSEKKCQILRQCCQGVTSPHEWLTLLQCQVRAAGLVPFFSTELSTARKSDCHYLAEETDEDEDSDEEHDGYDDERIDLEAIELDLRRTHLLTEIEPLRQVLMQVCAMAPARPAYCQGMNFIAAFLLRHLNGDARKASQIFSLLYQALDLDSVYCDRKQMVGLKLLLFQLEHLLELHLPKLAIHLARLDLQPFLYATSWFVTLLVNFLPESDATIAMDQLVTALSCAHTLPPTPCEVDTSSTTNMNDRIHFQTSATAQGWATIFKIILLALTYMASDIIQLDFDGTLRLLQNFSTVFAKKNISIAQLLKIRAHKLEREKTLVLQLAELRDQFSISDFNKATPSIDHDTHQESPLASPTVSRRLAGAAARVARKYASQVRASIPRSPTKPPSSIRMSPPPRRSSYSNRRMVSSNCAISSSSSSFRLSSPRSPTRSSSPPESPTQTSSSSTPATPT